MRIDRTHLPWLAATIVAIFVLTAAYLLCAESLGWRSGGTPLGLALGVLALGLMVFAALLGLRKRFPIWRIGRTTTWMRAHLWLGFLALPVALLHAAFHARGPLTIALMALTVLVVVSGLIGAWLQHTLPVKMMREVQFETIYDQIERIRGNLLREADETAGKLEDTLAPGPGIGSTVTLTMLTLPELQPEIAEFHSFYREEVREFIGVERPRVKLSDRVWSEKEFARLRRLLPPEAAPIVVSVEEICEEKRQLDRQVLLHRALHGWLLCHIPLSAALILLVCIHAVGALRY
jgi:hypothetical protein